MGANSPASSLHDGRLAGAIAPEQRQAIPWAMAEIQSTNNPAPRRSRLPGPREPAAAGGNFAGTAKEN